ncbi:uncharacterized protein B0I36DRAFT_352861 [Microdochium trichocladiopsis]|uniref:Uncharacterized protein n=1 Tax=Microdochium trichocladiopsis TaxID=1682393 RepID=A0A9P8XY06_9PEZI|nr:uncharacterized protein B0I36DRAFT_352861 [Microdochium trichocladiopsis]KAH7024650.1 hypothetical protein B0I36DRAFT_352861 [Microdochium trichocladiopsis]
MEVADEWAASFCLMCEQSSPGGDFCSPFCCMTNYQSTAISDSDSTGSFGTTTGSSSTADKGGGLKQDMVVLAQAKTPGTSYRQDTIRGPNPAISDLEHFRLLTPQSQHSLPAKPHPPSTLLPSCTAGQVIEYLGTTHPYEDSGGLLHHGTTAFPSDVTQQGPQETASLFCTRSGIRPDTSTVEPTQKRKRPSSRPKRRKVVQYRQLLPWERLEQARQIRRLDHCDDLT